MDLCSCGCDYELCDLHYSGKLCNNWAQMVAVSKTTSQEYLVCGGCADYKAPEDYYFTDLDEKTCDYAGCDVKVFDQSKFCYNHYEDD